MEQLEQAALLGDFNVIQSLISTGVDINIKNNNGLTALEIASSRGHLEIVKYLVINGADTSNMTIIEWASSGWLEKVKEYSKTDTNIQALKIASRRGHLDVVKHLVANGVDTSSMTIVEWASAGWFDKVKEYSLKGDIDTKNQDGDTALRIASEKGYLPIVKYLLKSGANPNTVTNKGFTALRSSASHGHLEVVQNLVEYGANINDTNNNGESALIRATTYGYTEIVQYLVTSGADINIKNNDSLTALMIARNKDYRDIVSFLNTL